MMYTRTLGEILKQKRGHEKYRHKTPGQDYTSVTYEFTSLKGAREFSQEVQRYSLSKYQPFFCDEFKYAQVTVFEPLETGKEQE